MSGFFSMFYAYISDIVDTVLSFRPRDIFDVAVVAFILYYAMKLVRETRALQFIKSIVVIFVVYFIADQFDLVSLRFLMGSILNVGLIAVIILFQPEIRRALEQIGRSKITDIGGFGGTQSYNDEDIALRQELVEIIADSCASLSATKTGALIVIERKIKLGDVINSGTIIDSKPSPELINNVFFKNSPLHDGAMVIRNGRLYAAGCLLPLSSDSEISRELGTRHRAALGMSEVSDAIVITVSEETGSISAALDSRLQRKLTVNNLSRLLAEGLGAIPEDEQESKKLFRRIKK